MKPERAESFFMHELALDQYWMNYSHGGEVVDLKGLLYFNHADKTAYQDTAKDNLFIIAKNGRDAFQHMGC